MNILFIHQNFPGQFKFLAPALVNRGHKVPAMTLQKVQASQWRGVTMVPYSASRGTTANVHPWVSDFETKTIRGEACFRVDQTPGADVGFDPEFASQDEGEPCRLRLKNLNNLDRPTRLK